MPRPRSEDKFHVYDNPASPRWWIWWLDGNGKRKRKATKYEKSLYSRTQAQAAVNHFSGVKKDGETYSIDWLILYTTDRLEKEGLEAKTINIYLNAFSHLKSRFGDEYDIRNLKRSQTWEIQRHILDAGCTPTTVNSYVRHLNAAFNRLLRSEIIDRNPSDNFERLRETNGNRKHLTLDETKRLLEVLENSSNEHGRRLVRILIYTGIRRSEVLLIEREDVDLSNNRFRVMNIKSSDHRKRWIAIPEKVREHFEYFMSASESPHPFKCCHPDTLTHWAKDFLKEAGLPEFHTHSLRHTFATLALEMGSRSANYRNISITAILRLRKYTPTISPIPQQLPISVDNPIQTKILCTKPGNSTPSSVHSFVHSNCVLCLPKST